MSRPSILVIHDTLVGWGTEKNLVHLGLHAPKEQLEVSYLVTGGRGRSASGAEGLTASFLPVPRVRVNRYTQPLSFAAKLAVALAWLFPRRKKFHVLLSTNPEESLVAFVAKSLLRMPAKLVVYNQIPLVPSTQTPFMRLALLGQLAIMRRCAGVACLSRGLHEHLEAAGVRTKTWIVPSCIDPEEIGRRANEGVREAWLEGDRRRTILWVGRLSNRQKRVDVLLRAIAQLRREQGATDFKTLFVGDGEDQESLEELAGDLGLADRVYFLGYRSNPYPYYALADLFVLSSDIEGFGNVIVEAMACGLPVVATDCRVGPSEILEGGKWGLLVPVGDHRRLAAEIHRVLTDEPLRAELAGKSRVRAQHFHCSGVLATFKIMCDEIVEGPESAGAA